MKNAAFTIVAKNYIGLAQILEGSIKEYSPEVDFYIIIADEFNSDESLPSNILIGKKCLDIPDNIWTNMSFKYDLTEFCTSIKPAAFSLLFNKGYEKVIYFDPDIYVFSTLKPIYDILDSKSVVLTPHICNIHEQYTGEQSEYIIMLNGIYNMGFCAFKNNEVISRYIRWWAERLKTKCFADRTMGYFTDQKWIDWLPGFLDSNELYVSRNLGMNVAPWNYFERKIILENNVYYVTDRNLIGCNRKDRLIFFHFSGYDYNCFKRGEIKRRYIESVAEYDDLLGVLSDYRDAIVKNQDVFDSFITQPYSYACFENGVKINRFHRRLYDGLIEDGTEIKNPFSVKEGSLYSELKKKKLIDENNSVDKVNMHNINNLDRKKALVNIFFKMIFRFLGYSRYSYFIRSLILYSRMQNHTFILNKENIYD